MAMLSQINADPAYAVGGRPASRGRLSLSTVEYCGTAIDTLSIQSTSLPPANLLLIAPLGPLSPASTLN